jgi:hypothetical protein
VANTTHSDDSPSPKRDGERARNDIESASIASPDEPAADAAAQSLSPDEGKPESVGRSETEGARLSKRRIPFWSTCSFLALYGVQELPLVLDPAMRDGLETSSHALAIVLGGYFTVEALRRAWDGVTSVVHVEGIVWFGRRGNRDPRARG